MSCVTKLRCEELRILQPNPAIRETMIPKRKLIDANIYLSAELGESRVAGGNETTPSARSLPNSRSQYKRILQPFEAPFRPSERDGVRTKDRGSRRMGRASVSHPIKSSGRPLEAAQPRGIKCSIGLHRVPIVKSGRRG